MVRFSGVDISYKGRVVLGSVTLDLHPPGHHVIMGPSGGGKSTLLKAILAAYTGRNEADLPQWSGELNLSGEAGLSYVPQESGLAPWLTIRQNIVLGRRLREGSEVRELGALGNQVVAALRLEPWLETVPSKVSVGTARRTALARAIVTQPDLLLLDEPFSGFDFDLREDAVALLRSEFGTPGRSIVLVTHEPYEAAAVAAAVHILPKTIGGPIRSLRRTAVESTPSFEARIREELLSTFREPVFQ